LSITCNDKLSWYSDNPKFIIAAKNLSQFSELHAKMWKDIVDDNKFENFEKNKKEKDDYLRNFNWLFSEKLSKNTNFGFLKIFNNYMFIILIMFILLLLNKKNLKKTKKSFSFEKKIIFYISVASVLLALYKYPLGRYVTSYLVIIIFFSFTFLFKNRLEILQQKKIFKILSVFIIICSSVFIFKNLSRVIANANTEYYQSPWPRIYENKKETKNLNSSFNKPQKFDQQLKSNILKIYFVNKYNYWTSDRSITCMYNSSPCAQSGNNFDNFEIVKTHQEYFIIKLIKD
tara:strand:+ start:432 stop:1295 length:864 start_codon:yes stop_codon:yes gene_type:complete